MYRHQATIDKVSIERANHYGREQVSYILKRASQFTQDPDRARRLLASECVVCYGQPRIGGAACTYSACPLCGERISSSNTNIDALCLNCAKENSLCRHCGADIELRGRRKPRPYESWPKPPQCVKCHVLMHKDHTMCLSCGHGIASLS